MTAAKVVLCDDGPGGQAALFADPSAIIFADVLSDVAPALARLDAARAAGKWVAGYLTYEAGDAFEPRLAAQHRKAPGPLLAFGVFDAPKAAPDWRDLPGDLTTPVPDILQTAYLSACAQVLEYIAAGDCYQVNLTFPMQAGWSGDPRGVFARLAARQPVRQGGFCDLGLGPAIVSRSPEVFFRIAQGIIETRPMKGTAPRDSDPIRDAALAADLRASEKGQAENLMIVDLLRNDLSRVCQVGSVKVPALFEVQSYATVHQMISRVQGQLLPGQGGLSALMPALFPCGSVTGAPKLRAMQIIRELESSPRGPYCGALGWMAPNGDAAFNVMIRTLSLWPNGRAVLNVGGGVVIDSTPLGEWEEALWKARFANLT